MSAKIKLAGIDSLFGSNIGEVTEIAISELHTFENHPFKVIDDDSMEDLKSSIKTYGVLVPITVRPDNSGGYEIISGHRRTYAGKMAGLKMMPAIVKDMTDAEATIAMVDSNLQREELLPSEKAFAYKMRLEALKQQQQNYKFPSLLSETDNWIRSSKNMILSAYSDDKKTMVTNLKNLFHYSGGSRHLNKGYRFIYNGDNSGITFCIDYKYKTELPYLQTISRFLKYDELADRILELMRTDNFNSENAAQIEQKKSSVEMLAEQVGESRANVQRYIRLTNLVKEFIEMTDEKELPLNTAVELSYLPEAEQKTLYDVIEASNKVPSMVQAKEIRHLYLINKLDEAAIKSLLSGTETKQPPSIKISGSVKKYFPKDCSAKTIEEKILTLLEKYKDEL